MPHRLRSDAAQRSFPRLEAVGIRNEQGYVEDPLTVYLNGGQQETRTRSGGSTPLQTAA
ncbi:MAG TPA: hypothetical protein VMW56_24955 [Candidatus Margulisiibacteriota bacterium]|nr:hypothetical protein [Candidatus Margulisiibacteriota bacterium]